jgi:hypothetical protein
VYITKSIKSTPLKTSAFTFTIATLIVVFPSMLNYTNSYVLLSILSLSMVVLNGYSISGICIRAEDNG